MFNYIAKLRRKLSTNLELGRAAGYQDWNKVIDIQERIDQEEGEKDNRFIAYAQAYYHLRNTEKASYYCHKAHEIDKDSFEACKMLADIYFTLGDQGKTVSFATKALQNQKQAIIESSLSITLFLLCFLKPFFFLKKVKKADSKIKEDLYRHKSQGNKWLNWAEHYIKANM